MAKKEGTTKLLEFESVKDDADNLVSSCSTRDTDFEDYENIVKLNLDSDLGKSSKEGVKTLFDPQGFNAVQAVVRMYASNMPVASVPIDMEPGDEGFTSERAMKIATSRANAERVERFLRALDYAQSTVTDRDWRIDTLYSLSIYGEVTQVTDSPLDELYGNTVSENGVEKEVAPDPETLEEIPAPYLFWVPNARMCYPRYSRRNGLITHLFKVKTKWADVLDSYGGLKPGKGTVDLNALDYQPDDEITIRDYLTKTQHTVWLDEEDSLPLLNVPMAYNFITREARRGASPGFFEEQEYQRMPLLYAYLKAGLCAAANLLLTVQYNNTLDFSNPINLFKMKQPEMGAPAINWDLRGSSVVIGADDSVSPLYRSLVPPELVQLLQTIGQMSQDSTISRASLGALPNSNMAYAALNLIAISSRMSTFLIAAQAERACEATYSKMLRRIYKRGQPVKVWGEKGPVSLLPSQVENLYRVRVKFRPDKQAEKQAVMGLAASLFGMGAGYDTVLEMLEEGGIVESASAAFENLLERKFLDAELPTIAKEQGEIVRAMHGFVKNIPERQTIGLSPQTGETMPAPEAQPVQTPLEQQGLVPETP